jgi:hypothetical protein
MVKKPKHRRLAVYLFMLLNAVLIFRGFSSTSDVVEEVASERLVETHPFGGLETEDDLVSAAGAATSDLRNLEETSAIRKPTPIVSMESRAPTPIVSMESRAPTPIVSMESRAPTPIVSMESRAPTPIVSMESRAPTPIVSMESRAPTPIVNMESRAPTPIVNMESRAPTPIVDEPTDSSIDKFVVTACEDHKLFRTSLIASLVQCAILNQVAVIQYSSLSFFKDIFDMERSKFQLKGIVSIDLLSDISDKPGAMFTDSKQVQPPYTCHFV